MLQHLRHEREGKEKPAVNHEEKKVTEEPAHTSKSQGSPFKRFQENLIEKVKHIPKPAEIKDKLQEKLQLETKLQMETVRPSDLQAAKGGVVRDISPPGALPPVVKLNSPELVKIEINPDIPGSQETSPERQMPADVSCQPPGSQGVGGRKADVNQSVPAPPTQVLIDRFKLVGEQDDDIVYSRKIKKKKKKGIVLKISMVNAP